MRQRIRVPLDPPPITDLMGPSVVGAMPAALPLLPLNAHAVRHAPPSRRSGPTTS